MRIFDITIPLSPSTPVWEGEKGITIQRTAELGPESEYNVSRCELGLHSGTHVDAPFHVIKNGLTVDAIPIENLVGPVQVVEISEENKLIDAPLLRRLEINNAIQKIIFKTQNSKYWDQVPAVFSRDYVGIDSSAAHFLVSLGMDLVGIDYFSISAFADLLQPHAILLREKVVLVENLDLRAVGAGVYDLYCLPLKVVGTDGAPARVILTAPNQ
jgi:arylformamidase